MYNQTDATFPSLKKNGPRCRGTTAPLRARVAAPPLPACDQNCYTDVAQSAARIANFLERLRGVEPWIVYNIGTTRLLHLCLPGGFYVPARERRSAGESQSMREKDSLTPVPCVNEDALHKVPNAKISNAI